MTLKPKLTRREFVGNTAAATAFAIVPSRVLGGLNHVAPSDKLNIAYIGCGTQGIREMASLITNPDVQITSVCDPNKFSTNYVDWSLHGIRNIVRKVLDEPSWGSGLNGIPGGRDLGQELVEKFYAKQYGSGRFKGCASYNDFRELLEKEKEIDAVKIMTPDHLHAAVSIASMKKGKHVVIHKPIANRMHEARLTIDTARKTGVSTHLLAWSERSGLGAALDWITKGAIGELREIHNWSNRPVWPQWTANPLEKPPVPDGFDWPLWLGPVPDRAYHPDYTHAVFRGWYDFGGGSIADMGHYSLWPLFLKFGINTAPVSARAYGTTTCIVEDHVSKGVRNNVAFPYSSIVEFDFPKQETLPPFKLYWYDGGMKPVTPDELDADDKELPREGMMFTGDKGKILASFHGSSPRLLPEKKMVEWTGSAEPSEEKINRDERTWIEAFKSGDQSPGSFLKATPVTETILLGAVALRVRKKVVYDQELMKITNMPEANQYMVREYRKGWEM
ncbi:MAG: Gfo/Idh/MocA family oxidoreductase [Bacteroidales bacterium]|nr:Gfo/Idh/MocA family oxidoreductase [Bacteroidales bacterium]